MPYRTLLLLLLIGIFLTLFCLKKKNRLENQKYSLYLALLVFGSLCYHTYFFDYYLKPGTGIKFFHIPEFYHYYVGTKYFNELGYFNLYEATVVADFEDDKENFQQDAPVRDLSSSNHIIERKTVVNRAKQIKSSFTDERWKAFKNDIGYFRSINSLIWHSSRNQMDHGYNGTPLTTMILGSIANISIFEPSRYMYLLAWIDTLLILALFFLVYHISSLSDGLLFLFLLFINPLNDFGYVGRSFLRYDYFLFLAVGILFFKKNKVLSGTGMALATFLRVFPLFFLVSAAFLHLLSFSRGRFDKKNYAFYLSFIFSAVCILWSTSYVKSPDNGNPWLSFYSKISSHHQYLTANIIGLRYLFSYTQFTSSMTETNSSNLKNQSSSWKNQTQKVWENNRYFFYLTVFLMLVGIIGRFNSFQEEDIAFLGILMIFLLLLSNHYYYSMFALIPFLKRDSTVSVVSFFICIIAIALTDIAYLFFLDTTFKFFLINLFLMVFFAGTLFIKGKLEDSAMAGS